MNRAVLYIHASNDEQTKHSFFIAEQKHNLEALPPITSSKKYVSNCILLDTKRLLRILRNKQ